MNETIHSGKRLPPGPLIIDIPGLELSTEDRDRLCHPLVGGIIFFSRNYHDREQISRLIRGIRSLRTPQLLITVDQEGGRVQRFQDGFRRLPAAWRLGRLYRRDPARGIRCARAAGLVMAGELLDVGVDMSFAPVFDVARSPSGVIGDRSFCSDPGIVSELAGAFIQGMDEAGMRATGKHFPGHGGVAEDSHFCLPVDHRTLDEVAARDLAPYRRLLDKLGAVMTAHVHFDRIDTELVTFSRFWLCEMLREEMGFDGLIVSDDLSMAGVGMEPDPARRAARALAAGCDMLLVCNAGAAVDSVLDGLDKHPPAPDLPRRLASLKGAPRTGSAAIRTRALEELDEFARDVEMQHRG